MSNQIFRAIYCTLKKNISLHSNIQNSSLNLHIKPFFKKMNNVAESVWKGYNFFYYFKYMTWTFLWIHNISVALLHGLFRKLKENWHSLPPLSLMLMNTTFMHFWKHYVFTVCLSCPYVSKCAVICECICPFHCVAHEYVLCFLQFTGLT